MGGESGDVLDTPIVEGANDGGAKTERNRLKIDVLAGMARLHGDVTRTSFTVFRRGSAGDSVDNQDHRRIGDPGLAKGRLCQGATGIAHGNLLEPVSIGNVPVNSRSKALDFPDSQMNFERVQCPCRRGGAKTLRPDAALGRP
jgi:hypothetical protein